MFLTITLSVATRPNAIVVPEDALVAEGVRQFLFVIVDGRAQRREVKLGTRMQGAVEIASGISADDQVIVRGLQRVRPNAPVAAKPYVAQPNS
jgi:membrane fusion protein (multidrug efflux system)